jgi:quercetin dioxygenase-like cupin family protein
VKLFRFDTEAAHPVSAHGSSGLLLAHLARLSGEVAISCMYLDPSGFVGYHPAAVHQLFLVVQGEGWVRGSAGGRVPIRAGHAAFWASGEWHETGSDSGMAAIVVESPGMDPGQLAELLVED